MATVLVVDDDRDIRNVIQATLEVAGYDVTVAASGAEALGKLRRRSFDAILLDIMMPEMDGYAVLEQLRSMPSRADIPVVVVTAKHDPNGVSREVEFGAVDHLAKPFFAQELEAVVERAIGSSQEAVDERRRVLSTDAELYGSIQSLFAEVRLSDAV
jgi:CheY-like chemotaxis protein